MQLKIREHWVGVLLVLTILICCPLQAATTPAATLTQLSPLAVKNAVVILPLGSSRDTQLFFTLSNNSGKSLSLTSIKSAQVQSILWVPAQNPQTNPWQLAVGQTLVLDGKSRYFQLKGLTQPITTGDELVFELGFSDGSKLQLLAKAQSAYDQIHGR